jgi:MYXO-CTERM domain-containing protein
MMRRSSRYGRLELILAALVWVMPGSGSAKGPKKAPNAARLREAKELRKQYNRLLVVKEFREAAVLAERACAILAKEHGAESVVTAGCFNDLGVLYHELGKYEKAKELNERALAIWEKELGPNHLDVATALNNVALVYESWGVYEKAESLYGRALTINEKALHPDDPRVAIALNNLGRLHTAQGEYRRAELLYERALAILEKALGPNHPDVAVSLNHLGRLYATQGRGRRAELLYQRALTICEKALGPDNFAVVSSIENLAGLYYEQGAYARAKPLFKRSLAIRMKTLGPDHPDVAASLHNLASLYESQGAYRVAEPLHERALAILEKALGPAHPDVATGLNNLAVLYFGRRAYEKAEPLFKRSLAIREKLGSDHHQIAASLSNLATLYFLQGKYAEAEPLYEQAVAIMEKSLEPQAVAILSNLAVVYHNQGKHDAGLALQRRALEIEDANLARTLPFATESRRLAYVWTLSGSLRYALSLHLRSAPESRGIAALALATLLRRKALIQDVVTQSHAVLRRSLPEDERHLLDELAGVESQIAALSNSGRHKPRAVYLQRIPQLGRERDRLWSELAKHSAFIEALEPPVTVEGVHRALLEGNVLVELARYVPQHDNAGVFVDDYEPLPPARYAAYIVFPDRFDWVDLGPAAPIDEHVKAFRKALQTRQGIPTDLYDAVMRPIVEKLGATRSLIIAPVGNLSLIPFGALHDGKQYLVEKYDLRYVTTGRDLLPPPASSPVATTPVTIVANPTGANLPDAKLEADFLTSLFPHARVLLDEQATETNVRTIERPLVLHMATHGFFGQAHNGGVNPLFRSGLYLADVHQVKVDRERDDGQLTAYEVSGMDLRGTQLVVLSACETGMGATGVGGVDMNEGVFGLRRAFAMAGARTTVMSLWEVSGVTAQKTMEAYYRKLAEGMGRGEAMQAVQLEMLRSEQHAHPKDWAAFIVSGDDTPMVFPEGEEPRVEEPQGPPPVQRTRGCAVAAASPDRDPSVPAFLLGLVGLGALRRRRA